MKSPIITKILALCSKISQSENCDELLAMTLQLKDMANVLQKDIVDMKKMNKVKNILRDKNGI